MLRSTKPSLCYFALNLVRRNFTCPFAISRLTWMRSNFSCYEATKPLRLKVSTYLRYFALNLMHSNFTCYEALNRPLLFRLT
ncbi:MAG: hypothetical protein IPL33_20860 [Sphingobacteriales bacterium]|nr:hypothetical protein [Sphingobacteriales bacterium]